MLIDTHVHLLESKTCRPDWSEISYTFHVAKEKNIDVLCVTEHRDAVGYEELFIEIFLGNRLGGQLNADGALQLAAGTIIRPAAEVSLFGGGDMGVHSDLNTVMSLSGRKNEYNAEDLLSFLSGRGEDYVSVAHHLLLNGKWWAGFEQVIHLVDAIEIPGKQASVMDDYLKLAVRHSKSRLSGSDAHTWIQLGAGLTRIEYEADRTKGVLGFDTALFKKFVLENETVPCVSNSADELVRIARLYKGRPGL